MTRAKTPGRPGRRRALRGVGLTLLTVLLLAVMAHGVGWLWLTGAMAVGFSDWVTQQRAQGWVIEHEAPSRGGWPFAARIAVPRFRMAGWTTTLPQGFAWEAGRIDLTIAPPRMNRLLISAGGPQRLRSGMLAVPYAATRVEAVVPLAHGPRSGVLTLEGLRAELPAGILTAARIDAHATPGPRDGEPSLGLQIAALQVGLPPHPGLAALGPDMARLWADVVLTGPPSPPLPLTPRERAELWRAGGGTLELRESSLQWGPLAGGISMVLRLDPALQPIGQGRLLLERPVEAIDTLAAAGAIAPQAATAARVMAGLMARTPEGGGTPQLDLPIRLDNGVVTLARLPVLRLPPVVWPDGIMR